MPSNCLTATENFGMFGARSFVLAASLRAGCACRALALRRRPPNGRSQPERVLHDALEREFRRHLGARRQEQQLRHRRHRRMRVAKHRSLGRSPPPRHRQRQRPRRLQHLRRRHLPNVSRSDHRPSPIVPASSPANEQGAFYGVGNSPTARPNYPASPWAQCPKAPRSPRSRRRSNSLGPPADPFGDSAWATAALLAAAHFAHGVTPAFVAGSSGNVFTSLGTSTAFRRRSRRPRSPRSSARTSSHARPTTITTALSMPPITSSGANTNGQSVTPWHRRRWQLATATLTNPTTTCGAPTSATRRVAGSGGSLVHWRCSRAAERRLLLIGAVFNAVFRPNGRHTRVGARQKSFGPC